MSLRAIQTTFLAYKCSLRFASDGAQLTIRVIVLVAVRPAHESCAPEKRVTAPGATCNMNMYASHHRNKTER